MVARIGWPCSPKTSQKTTGNWSGWYVRPMRLGALHQRFLGLARGADAGEIALDVGGEHRHAGLRKAFGQHLQRDGLAGAGRAGDQPVAVAEPQIEHFVFAALADDDAVFGQAALASGRFVDALAGVFAIASLSYRLGN